VTPPVSAAEPHQQPELQPESEPERRAHLRVAPDLRKRRRRARRMMSTIVLVTVASLFTLVGFHVLAAQSAFSLDKLAKERNNEQLRYERLRDRVARLSAPATVIDEATKLGMQRGDGITYVQADAAAPHTAPPTGVPKVDPAKKHLDESP
jgi:hypothetical protein